MPDHNIGWDALNGAPSESTETVDSDGMDSLAHIIPQLHAALDAIVLLVAELERLVVAVRAR